MANGGFLVPPSEAPEKARLWDGTWKRLERFLPGMFREIFPEPETPKGPLPVRTSNVGSSARKSDESTAAAEGN
jgi:brefeldin A-resistance guanine nucleotide exchange factor 1